MTTSDSASTNWALAAHLSGLLAYVTGLGGILAPMVIWLIKKDEDEFVGRHALEAVNFQITVFIACVVSIPLIFVIIGIPMILLVALFQVVFSIIAALTAAQGSEYRYPWTLRLVKG
ncbi:MAG: putative Tic20 family protein [Planctomycetota bacterium]|jgi:uncharacterized Tic20 family protein